MAEIKIDFAASGVGQKNIDFEQKGKGEDGVDAGRQAHIHPEWKPKKVHKRKISSQILTPKRRGGERGGEEEKVLLTTEFGKEYAAHFALS